MSKIWHRLIEYWSKYLLPPDIWWQNYVMSKKITKKTTTKLTHLRPCCHLGLCLNQFSVIAPDAEMTVVMTGQRRNLGLRETLGPALWHKYHQNKVKTLPSPPPSLTQTGPGTWLETWETAATPLMPPALSGFCFEINENYVDTVN